MASARHLEPRGAHSAHGRARALLLLATLAAAAGNPCDIYAADGAPCVAAHSTVRALFSNYGGRLYQVNRSADGALLDVRARAAGGVADAAAQDAFCGAPSPSPPPPAPPPALPPLNSTVSLVPAGRPALAFRHCDAQGFATPPDGSADFAFKLVRALSGAAGLYSLQSVNFPEFYVAPISTAEPGRLGVARAPPAADASWAIAPASGGGFALALPARGGLVAAVGNNLTGNCAGSYAAPSAGVFLAPAGAAGAAWLVVPAGAPPAPPACTISVIYDQTGNANDLSVAPAGGAAEHRDRPVDAAGLRVRAGGADVYAAFFEAGNGYRNDATRGVATGNDAEVIYMVTSGVHYNGGCCFDYGNAEVNNHDDGAGTMEAVYFGSCAFIAHHVAPPAAPKTATLTNPKTRPNRAPRP